jgi:excisionase family DNA binding protein
MDTNVSPLLTSGQVARELSTTVPRVLRAVRRGEVRAVRRGNRFLFDAAAVRELRRRWGVAPAVDGLTREDMLVLAALGRRPFGLASARAVARAAGVSPTTAGRSLSRLAERGYVARDTVRVAEGEARDAAVWTVRWTGSPWLRVAETVGQVVLPEEPAAPSERPRHAQGNLPPRLAHLFWNEDLQALDLDRHASLVADRILRSEDPEAHAWMLRRLPRRAILQATGTRNLDPRRAHLGRLLASGAR